MCEREQRGLVIAATSRLERKGQTWMVPSQNMETPNVSRYAVRLEGGKPTCTCPDFETRGGKCKHIFAVEFVIQRELFPDGTETETRSVTFTETTVRKPTYRQSWPEYNAAQMNEKAVFQTLLSGLCNGIIDHTPPKTGRPRMPMSAAIFGAAYKVYSTVSGRRFTVDMKQACEAGHCSRAPHYNSIFKILESEEATPVLMALILEAAKPLRAIESTFACDASGFSTCRFERWFDQKYGGFRSKREWVKVHIMCGVKTNVVTAIEISPSNDCPQLPALLATTSRNFSVKEVCADKGYLSADNFETIKEHGADGFIPFKSNSVANHKGTHGEVWVKAFHYFHLNREAFLSRYHQRSNVESTFSMVKAKFGDAIRSKTPIAMRNEALCKFLCHNVCCLISAVYELGLSPMFWGDGVCGQNGHLPINSVI